MNFSHFLINLFWINQPEKAREIVLHNKHSFSHWSAILDWQTFVCNFRRLWWNLRLFGWTYRESAAQLRHVGHDLVRTRDAVVLSLFLTQQLVPPVSLLLHHLRHPEWQRPHEVVTRGTVPVPCLDRQSLRIVVFGDWTAELTYSVRSDGAKKMSIYFTTSDFKKNLISRIMISTPRWNICPPFEVLNYFLLKRKFLYSAVSCPRDRSKRFTLYFPDRPVPSDSISASLGSIQPYATINARRLLVHISTTVYSQVLIYTANWTGASSTPEPLRFYNMYILMNAEGAMLFYSVYLQPLQITHC